MRKEKRVVTVLCILVLIIGLCSGCGSKDELSKLKEEALITAADKTCQSYYKKKEFVGMSVALIKNGQVKYLNYGTMEAGQKNKPVTEETIYEIASISKTFAGVLLADECLKGKVKLEDPVQDYLDYEIENEYKGAVMTLEQLATHTSGLPRMPRNWRSGPNPYKNYTRDKLKEFMQENILSRKPGSVYEYSNLSFGLLGCILEDIEKTPYAQLVQSRICEPLDMKNTVMVLSPDQKKMKAKPYSTKDTKGYEWDFDALSACAGLKSNTRDLARYVAANMEQIPLSKELTEAFSMAHKVHFKGDPTLGLAFRYSTVDGKDILEHDGLAGAYTSYIAFSKEYGVGVAVLCNSADGVIGLGTSLMSQLMKENK